MYEYTLGGVGVWTAGGSDELKDLNAGRKLGIIKSNFLIFQIRKVSPRETR